MGVGVVGEGDEGVLLEHATLETSTATPNASNKRTNSASGIETSGTIVLRQAHARQASALSRVSRRDK